MSNNRELTSRLQKLAEDIEDEKAETSRIEGRRDALMKSLKERFGMDSVEAGHKELANLQRKADKADIALTTLVDELEKEMPA